MSSPPSRARQLYPTRNPNSPDRFREDNYTPIIKSLGNVLILTEGDGRRGDTFLLLEKDGRYGFTVIGWGSCSGCDALLGCRTYDEADELISQIENEIKWFDTLEDAKTYVSNGKDRRMSHYSHGLEWIDFVAQVRVFQSTPTPSS